MQTQPKQEIVQQSMPSGPKTLHVYSEGTFSKSYRIADSDKNTTLYTLQIHSWSKPNVQIYSNLDSEKGEMKEVGSGTFHSFSSAIDMVVRGQPIALSRNGSFSSGHQWRSPAMGGVLVKWKTDGAFTSDKICYVDGHKTNPIARWETAGMSMSKQGKIHILDPSLMVPGSSGFEEIVISAMIEMEVTRRRRNRSSGGGAAAGGGGGGGC